MKTKIKNKKQFALYLLVAFLCACGIILIVNGIAILVDKSVAFVNNPVGQYQVAEITVPHRAKIQPVAVFEAESQTVREVTAYNAGDPSQTDASPCITADGANACEALAQGEKICAANFAPLGSYLEIEGYGICRVADRMNSRFANRVDIAMEAHEKDRAVKFGLQHLEVSQLR
jgi:3D (Asp-Asp-Asp) domain-containing protein